MVSDVPRGIAVADIGSTNMKVLLFRPDGTLLAERRAATRHVEGPPYRHLDPAAMIAFLAAALPDLDALLPVDVVVPCAHGATLACLDRDGGLALPVMDYTQDVPPDVVARYRSVMPPFAEAGCGLLPMALTHGLQLFWQAEAWPADFARIATIIPWIQYVGFALGGRAVTEIASLSCQSHLVDVAHGGPSALVRRMGWTHLFPPLVPAWETIGTVEPEFRGPHFRGAGRVLAGLHDSSANFLRYQAARRGDFALLSTGTWIIAFDTATPIAALSAACDTVTNTSIFGQPLACARFYGGLEFATLAGAAQMVTPDLEAARELVRGGVMALPSFSGSAGPVPGTEHRGRIVGVPPASAAARTALASLYCALMVAEQLDCVGARNDVIVDGPFAQNIVFMRLLAALRPGQRVLGSALRDGTAAGAACLALMRDGKLPRIDIALADAAPAEIPELMVYQKNWREKAHANCS